MNLTQTRLQISAFGCGIGGKGDIGTAHAQFNPDDCVSLKEEGGASCQNEHLNHDGRDLAWQCWSRGCDGPSSGAQWCYEGPNNGAQIRFFLQWN